MVEPFELFGLPDVVNPPRRNDRVFEKNQVIDQKNK
jgi:hypothetical protein